ncbi:hypothetical protein NFI96_023995 [Prochilodus magdalenae]|nr:hypothetical protein NFI96_023995 [Prochilodus magdalenae]
MGRLKHTRPNKRTEADPRGKETATAPNSRNIRSMTPLRGSLDQTSHFHKTRRSNSLGFKGRGVMKPLGRRFEGRRGYSKGMVTPNAVDPSQDSTSIVMPSGVSSFLLDCMDLDSEAEDTLPSIEVVRKADTYDEGTGLVSEDEILHGLVKNSTLLDLSQAMDISMQQPPNLSSILELSPVIDGPAGNEWFCQSPPQPVSPLGVQELHVNAEFVLHAGSDIRTLRETFEAEERTPETKRVVVLSPVVKRRPWTGRGKPIKCRKVTFNDIVETRDITVLKPVVGPRSQPCDVQKNELSRNSSSARKELMDPQDLSSHTATFFDFADENERDIFFQRLKTTYTFQFPAKPVSGRGTVQYCVACFGLFLEEHKGALLCSVLITALTHQLIND